MLYLQKEMPPNKCIEGIYECDGNESQHTNALTLICSFVKSDYKKIKKRKERAISMKKI